MSSIYSVQAVFNEFRKSMRLSLPLIATELLYGIGLFISTAMIAHLGAAALAANAIVWSVFITLMLFFTGILFAVGIMVAQSYGAEDWHGIQQVTIQGIILSFLFAIPMVAIVWFVPKILFWTGQDPEMIALAVPYFHAWAWCMLPINLFITFEQFLVGIGRTRLVLALCVLQVPLEIIAYYALIFGHFGMPKVGLPGVAYGMSFAIAVTAIIAILYVQFIGDTKRYKLLQNCWRVNKRYLLELLRVGTPLAFALVLEVGLFAVIAFMIGHFGEVVLAAHQIAYQCFVFALAVIFGLIQGTTVRVGHEVGRNNREGIKLAFYVSAGIGFSCMLLLAVIYIGFPQLIMNLDIVDVHARNYQALVHYATSFLAIAAVLQLSDCFRLIAVGALRGLKDTKIPMYISGITFWLIAFPCAYLLAFPLHLGGAGVWWGLVIGLVICAITLVVRFHKVVKRIDLKSLIT